MEFECVRKLKTDLNIFVEDMPQSSMVCTRIIDETAALSNEIENS